MLEPRSQQLQRMGDALRAAARDADWAALGKLVAALGPRLRALAAPGPWSAAERQAIVGLRAAHDAAAEAAGAASNALAAKLDQLGGNKDGWLAYAAHGDIESGSSEARA